MRFDTILIVVLLLYLNIGLGNFVSEPIVWTFYQAISTFARLTIDYEPSAVYYKKLT
jgi:hypothetical protein